MKAVDWLHDATLIHTIMDMGYNMFRSGLNEPQNRDLEIEPEVYKRMRRANIKLERGLLEIRARYDKGFSKADFCI